MRPLLTRPNWRPAWRRSGNAASELLKRFSNRAGEVVDRFRRYGPDAIAHPSAGPIAQINAAIEAYAPVYDELKEKTDSYRKATAEFWGEGRSAEFQALVDEALRIHERVYSLNALGTLITDCRHGWEKTCPVTSIGLRITHPDWLAMTSGRQR